MQIPVLRSQDGGTAEQLELSETAFGARFNEPLVHQAVVAYLAGARQGTRAQKNRSAVRGGGAKPWRQKGTGHARAGSIRSPLWRGGGKIFPAAPRDFSQKLNRKMYRGAMRAILSELVRQGRLVVVDELRLDAPKTRDLLVRLRGLGAEDALVVTEGFDPNVALSGRNLPRVEVCDVPALNPVALVAHEKVVMTLPALKKVEAWLS